MLYRAILGEFVARTAIHIGTGKESDVTDALCRCDAEGSYIIPGTAIGGVLRSIATKLAPALGSRRCRALWSKEILDNLIESECKTPCGCRVCRLFGEINPGEGGTEETGGRASRLFVAHSKASLPSNRMRIRDGVGINRSRRTAAEKVKFDLEVLPKGSAFVLRIEMEDLNDDDERLLAATLAELIEGRMRIGGRTARGLGAFKLEKVKLVERDLSEAENLVAFLKDDEPWKTVGNDKDPIAEFDKWFSARLSEAQKSLNGGTDCFEGVARSFVTLNFNLKIDGFFLTNDTTVAAQCGFDHVPLLDAVSKEGKLILAGAGLRGVIRSHAERIARTLATLRAKNVHEFGLVCPACDPTSGSSDNENKTENIPLANCDSLLKKIISTDDEVVDRHLCLGCRLFGSARRGSRLVIEDAESEDKLEKYGKILDFLAIDRFTGGGKDGAKFDAFAALSPSFQVRMHLENPASWELGWLALVLRDLKEKILTIGFGSAKGFGRAYADGFDIDYCFISENGFAGLMELTSSASYSGLYRKISWRMLNDAKDEVFGNIERKWAEDFNEEIGKFSRIADGSDNGLPDLKSDTFFGSDAERLYGKARIF